MPTLKESLTVNEECTTMGKAKRPLNPGIQVKVNGPVGQNVVGEVGPGWRIHCKGWAS